MDELKLPELPAHAGRMPWEGLRFGKPGYTADQMRDYARAALADRAGAAAGWKMVPLEPTEDMHAAAVRTIVRCNGNADFPPRVWRAMLAAAPAGTQEPADARGVEGSKP